MHPFYYVSLPKPHKKEQAEQKKQWKKSIDQGCQISWISQESPGFEIFLLAENLLISGADFRYFLLILVLFPDYLSASLLSTIWWNISWVNKKVYNNSTKITRGYQDLFIYCIKISWHPQFCSLAYCHLHPHFGFRLHPPSGEMIGFISKYTGIFK